jgi:hypothetical protein
MRHAIAVSLLAGLLAGNAWRSVAVESSLWGGQYIRRRDYATTEPGRIPSGTGAIAVAIRERTYVAADQRGIRRGYPRTTQSLAAAKRFPDDASAEIWATANLGDTPWFRREIAA